MYVLTAWWWGVWGGGGGGARILCVKSFIASDHINSTFVFTCCKLINISRLCCRSKDDLSEACVRICESQKPTFFLDVKNCCFPNSSYS